MSKSVFTDAYVSIVERVVELRKSRGVSQVELAGRLSKTQQFVSKIERLDRRMDVLEFAVIVRALGDDPAKILADILTRIPEDSQI
jgi:transcriptional regulator with XRE-family HTH domain